MSPPDRTARFVTRALVFGGVLAPLVVLVGFIARHAVNVPFWDQWELVPYLAKHAAGTLSLGDLWRFRQNEHRLFFPISIMIALAGRTHWDIRFELAVIVLLAVVLFVVLARMWRRLNFDARGLAWELPLLSLFVFSLGQWENWFWGWQIQMLLNIAALSTGLALLSGARLGFGRLVVALALGFVAQFSFSNGVLFWPIGIAVLLLCHPKARREMIAFGLAGVASTAAFLSGYPPSLPAQQSWRVALAHPFLYGGYVLVYLGAPIGDGRLIWAALLGAGGLGGLVVLLVALRRRGVALRELAGFLAVATFAIGSALLTGLGRLGFGVGQALTSRYVAFATLMWAANLALLSKYLRSGEPRTERRGRRVAQAAVVGMAAMLLLSAAGGARLASRTLAIRKTAVSALASGRGAGLDLLYPVHAVLVERRAILEKLHLSVFR
jgi:hypothetical protein